MNTPGYEPALPEDFQQADELLEKADALIRRHQAGHDDGFDDLPVLTEVVDLEAKAAADVDEAPDAADAEITTAPAGAAQIDAAPTPPAVSAIDESLLVERLISLDAKLTLAIEDWVTAELPQILSREFDALSERIRAEAIAHLRATLIPELSEDISALIDPPKN
ncbi:MAG: hypothetical protein KDH20_07725 [Rhodocyclaceae bacterium]|nr:hypothetical protein [Rhodocyclaceae bacterium]